MILKISRMMNEAAAVIEQNKTRILEEWVSRVRDELSAPKITIDPVLRDHLPLLLDDIILIMRRYENNEWSAEKTNFEGMLDNSIGHGRHRSSSAGYDIEQVLKEYIILHRLLTDLLRSRKVFTTEVGDVIKYIIENSMLYAAVSFQQSLQEVRQKLMGVLVHDVRNPVSAAYLAVSMIDQDDEPERFGKIRTMLRTSLKRSLDLLEGFLESVSISAGQGISLHFAEGDLLDYIKSLHGEASAIYANEVILKCPEEPILGVFDIAMVRRVLENILNNAVKYGKRGAPITITVENTPDEVTISIHNHGNPIPEHQQKEIFQFLNTSKGNGSKKLKSWGMGLTLVNAVAEAHGGHLELKSNEKEGTTFKLVLQKKFNVPGKIKSSVNFAIDSSHLESF